jgi:hypothetical protein
LAFKNATGRHTLPGLSGEAITRWGLVAATVVALIALAAPGAGASLAAPGAGASRLAAPRASCPGWGRPAIAADAATTPRGRARQALRVFAIQLRQDPAAMATVADYRRAIVCAFATEVAPYLARGRPNLVVLDEDVGLETLAIGARGAAARRGLAHPAACGDPPCRTLQTLTALDAGYARALAYLETRHPRLATQLGRPFVAATDQFVRVFMGTMAALARRYRVYVIVSNTQAPFRLTHAPAAVHALAAPDAPAGRGVFAPTATTAYDQTFVWGPADVHPDRPAPVANLIADNRKVPLTTFEQLLGFGAGPSRGVGARRNLRPIAIPARPRAWGSPPACPRSPTARSPDGRVPTSRSPTCAA